MTAHLWPSAWAEPPRITPAPSTPPAGLPHLEDVRPGYKSIAALEAPWPVDGREGPSSTATQPRPYLATIDGQPRPRRRDPLPRELAHPAPLPPFRGFDPIAAAGPDAATRLGHARGVAGRMRHELETHGRRALAVVQDPTATSPARADADAQLVAWRTGILAIEAILAAVAGAPSAACDLPPDLRAT